MSLSSANKLYCVLNTCCQIEGRYTFPGFTAYSMSKSAAVSFADGLRREMKKWSITVHTIEPTLYKYVTLHNYILSPE
jgi:NAD(P)-dependent dehydrogenase (short-subunit alcohol dehydrogenase family)